VTRCVNCGEPRRQAATGRPPKWCSDACRKAYSRRAWPPQFERAEEALVFLIASGDESPELGLERIVSAFRSAV